MCRFLQEDFEIHKCNKKTSATELDKEVQKTSHSVAHNCIKVM